MRLPYTRTFAIGMARLQVTRTAGPRYVVTLLGPGGTAHVVRLPRKRHRDAALLVAASLALPLARIREVW